MASSPFTPLTASSMLSAMGCEKFQRTPGNLASSSRVHRGDQLVFIFVEDGAPFFFGLEVDEIFGVEEAGGVGAVVGAADLAGDDGDFGKGGEDDARLVGMTRMPSVGPVLGASVPRTQMAPSSRCGRNSEPITPLIIRKTARAKAAAPTPTVKTRWSIAQRTAMRY